MLDDLTPAQKRVLTTLKRMKVQTLTMSQIAERARCSQSTVASAISALERKGLIARSGRDYFRANIYTIKGRQE